MLVLALACESNIKGQGESNTARPRMDTLNALELGSLKPEVAENLDLVCDEVEMLPGGWEPPGELCSTRGSASAPILFDADLLIFKDGTLIWIMQNLDDDWNSVPVDTLVRRLEAFGEPAETGLESETGKHYWMWKDSIYRRTLSCPDTVVAEGCGIVAFRVSAQANQRP